MQWVQCPWMGTDNERSLKIQCVLALNLDDVCQEVWSLWPIYRSIDLSIHLLSVYESLLITDWEVWIFVHGCSIPFVFLTVWIGLFSVRAAKVLLRMMQCITMKSFLSCFIYDPKFLLHCKEEYFSVLHSAQLCIISLIIWNKWNKILFLMSVPIPSIQTISHLTTP